MDVMMPVMDGLTATAEIRKDSALKKLPIIMLTAKAMPDDQRKCIEAGASDYMAKPLDVEKLLSLVRVWMPR
jgi:CheY-like chemotaxis protein